jgi:hypothetical protein
MGRHIEVESGARRSRAFERRVGLTRYSLPSPTTGCPVARQRDHDMAPSSDEPLGIRAGLDRNLQGIGTNILASLCPSRYVTKGVARGLSDCALSARIEFFR